MPGAAWAASPKDQRVGQPDSLTGLVLVSTPIGNLGDMTTRAKDVLASCNLVLCEDTRRTGRLLSALDIRVPMEALHEHNEDARTPAIIGRLREQQRIALVSDAGTPLVSDPGYRLVREVIAQGLPLTALPGPNAAVTALILSGLPPTPFLFLGFPPPKQAARRAAFSQLRAAERAGLAATMIWHEAPHRLVEMLDDLCEIFGDRSAAVARELTKHFETVERGKLRRLAEFYRADPARGEITVLIGKPETDDPEALDDRLRSALATHSVKDAAALVSGATGLPRKIVYARALELSEKS